MMVFPDQRVAGNLNTPILTLSAAALLLLVAVAQFSGTFDLGLPGPVRVVFATVFLILAGGAIEYALGRGGYLLGLMLFALLAVGLPMAFDAGREPGLAYAPLAVGAMSGGLAGMFTGWRIRPLFFILGLVGRYSLPSYVLMLAWLVSEWVIVLTSGPSFEGVLGALGAVVSGFVIGVVTNQIGLTGPRHLGKDYVEQLIAEGLGDAEELVREHRLAKARRLLSRLLQLAPQEIAVQKALYAAWKYDPTRLEFHKAAARLLDRPATDPASNALVIEIYSDYLAVTQGQPELPIDLDLSLARLFVRNGKMDLAANIINAFLHQKLEHKAMAESILSIAEGYVLTDRTGKAIHYAETVIAMYPDSRAALSAQSMLKGINEMLT
jgi:hypothetical protein